MISNRAGQKGTLRHMSDMKQKRAIVLLNLGGPDTLNSVEPFLKNFFMDPAIIGAPLPIRWMVSRLIAKRRGPIAREIYAHLGGGSPILKNTRDQAAGLEAELTDLGETKVFVAMRYWHPMSDEVAQAVKEFGPDEVILLPLYPQFSTTTSGSSIKEWHRAAGATGLDVKTRTVCCYPAGGAFIPALTRWVLESIETAKAHGPVRVLFSAHGLPENIVKGGDPYQWQVEQTAAAVVEKLNIPDLDWIVCYQSRVGPLKWIGPDTEGEIERAAKDGASMVVVPLAFVSEHSETLVELDIEYRELAEDHGAVGYTRTPTVGAEPDFISGLAVLVRNAVRADHTFGPEGGVRLCPANLGRCACAEAAKPEELATDSQMAAE